MEKNKKRLFGMVAALLLVLFLLLLGFWAANRAHENKRHQDTLERVKKTKMIHWGVKTDTKLFGLVNTKSGQSEGFDVDLAKALTKQIGKQLGLELTPSFTPVNASSKVQLLKNTNIDGVMAVMTITKERAKVVDFSNPYFPAGNALLVRKDSGVQSIKDLNDPSKTILIALGTTAADTVKKEAPKAKVLALQDYASAMQALKAGQGQAIVTDNAILYGLVAENPDYQVVGGIMGYAPYGIAFDHNQPGMVKQANQALESLEKDGTYNTLIKKWFSQVPGLDLSQLEVQS
ncbi:transporter substrate-binding domain-containing protein [Fructobacillus sp. M1-13]|uniref:Transporter substrate-binding domain-containing protein n=1 Tax=Fructobacillus papyriferae TaxID=2713171 RepID=A0ABS5QPW2_9LACO|nr:transporter substrate-binding domain-containing protein [Fructobacillus papyriferae]MBS9335223.1 transporter substrate-binding domain-containing protein [Fructobacillus papyriferae]MCD2159108.1 transporter substrate-binding domain-containing protein [Fructobacillus papyriferae]